MQKTVLRPGWAVYSGNVVAFPERQTPSPPAPIEGLLSAGLDALGQGVAILAADGSLRYANAALHAFAARDEGLELYERGIASSDFSAQSRLTDAVWVALAAAAGAVRVTPHPARIALPRPRGGAPWIVQVRPLCIDGVSGAVLTVNEPQPRAPRAAELSRILGLTPREAELAVALIGGRARRGVPALRRRLGCRSTVELIALLLSLRV